MERRIDQLTRLENFALPLIDILGSLPRSAQWGEWLERLSELAQMALRHPESVLAVLSELQPMGDVGPAALDEVYDVLSEKLGSLRTDPPRRRYGHVFVGSIEETRGRSFDVVFLPGLAEGLVPAPRARRSAARSTNIAPNFSTDLDTQDQRVARERMLLRYGGRDGHQIAWWFLIRAWTSRKRARAYRRFTLLKFFAPLKGACHRCASSASGPPLALLRAWIGPRPRIPETAIDDAEYDLASLQTARSCRATERRAARATWWK